MIEYGFEFSDNQDITADFSGGVVSSNVFDAGAAVKKFEGEPGKLDLVAELLSSTHDPSVTVKLIGADNAALTSNPETIASATLVGDDDGVFPVRTVLKPGFQKAAKRYYGMWYIGDDSSARAKVNAYICTNNQSNQNP